MYDVTPAGVTRHEVVATEVGLAAAPVSALVGGTAAENAALVEAALAGEAGPRRDVILLNAAAAFLAAGRVASLGDGVTLAAETIDTGLARDLLARLRAAKTAHEAARPAGVPA
jgi:anthranilate phosphoribosyltransferase